MRGYGRLYINLFVISFIAISPMLGMAQTTKKGTILLSGKVVDENKKGLQSTIKVFRNRDLVNEIPTSKIGKFQIALTLQDSVSIVVVQDGYVSKTLVVSTKVPVKKEREDFLFPFFIDLYPTGKAPSYVDLDRPVGKIKYSGVQFIYDIEYTKKANEQLKEFVRERKDLKIQEYKE